MLKGVIKILHIDTKWSDPRIIFVFVLHKRLFVFVHAIRLCAVPELNFVHWHKRGS